jgi:Rrf2 family iron-sulfur cluster assembly transcriptional regulator
MHITAQEEYGLRCLLRVAKHESGFPIRTQEVAISEGLSLEYAAKLMRTLKKGGFVASTRGSAGGYLLSRPARDITVWQILEALGGPLYEEKFCDAHTGSQRDCTHSTNCSIRALWRNVNGILETALSAITLADLSRDEGSTRAWLLSSVARADEARREAARTGETRHEAGHEAFEDATVLDGTEAARTGRRVEEAQP